MKSLLFFVFSSFSFFSLIHCYIIPTSISENQLEKITLVQKETLLLLQSYDCNSPKMFIDIVFSHPSNFILTFNQYKDNYNDTLSQDFSKNQTNLNIKEKNDYLYKSRIILDLPKNENETKKQILVSIKKNDNSINATKNEKYDKKLAIRYILGENDDEYQLNNTEIKIQQDKYGLKLYLEGIKEEEDDLTEISSTYIIDICDKNILESKFENIDFYSFSEENLSLFHMEEKSNSSIKNGSIIEIKAPLNDKKEYYIFAKLKIKNYILQYKAAVLDISKIIEPEIDAEKNRKNNKSILLLILSCFGGSVILTYIMVLIYLSINKKTDIVKKIEQDYDYKNIGEIKTLNEDEA